MGFLQLVLNSHHYMNKNISKTFRRRFRYYLLDMSATETQLDIVRVGGVRCGAVPQRCLLNSSSVYDLFSRKMYQGKWNYSLELIVCFFDHPIRQINSRWSELTSQLTTHTHTHKHVLRPHYSSTNLVFEHFLEWIMYLLKSFTWFDRSKWGLRSFVSQWQKWNLQMGVTVEFPVLGRIFLP